MAPSPVMASIRRTPAEMLLSETILKTPISPVRRDVRAAAEFLAEVGDGHDADLVAILLAEQRHGAGGDRLIDRHHVGGDLRVAQDLLVDETLDFDDFGRDRARRNG